MARRGVYQRPLRSFGTAVREVDGKFVGTCEYCTFRTHLSGRPEIDACREKQAEAPRPIPNVQDTPEWCPMLAGMLRDVAEAERNPGKKITKRPSVIRAGG